MKPNTPSQSSHAGGLTGIVQRLRSNRGTDAYCDGIVELRALLATERLYDELDTDAIFDALAELAAAVNDVCGPLLTASDGGAMWISMRDRPGASKSVKKLKAALEVASALTGAIPD